MGRMPFSAPPIKGEDAIQRMFAAMLDGVRELVRAELEAAKGDGDDWIDQERSPLGRREHCKLARRGALPARKVAKRWLVRRSDLDRYIEQHGVPAKPPQGEQAAEPEATEPREPCGDDVLRELGLERVRGKR